MEEQTNVTTLVENVNQRKCGEIADTVGFNARWPLESVIAPCAYFYSPSSAKESWKETWEGQESRCLAFTLKSSCTEARIKYTANEDGRVETETVQRSVGGEIHN